jgi:hypothetical protein
MGYAMLVLDTSQTQRLSFAEFVCLYFRKYLSILELLFGYLRKYSLCTDKNETQIMWHDVRKPEKWSQSRRSFLGNESVTHSCGNKYASNNRVWHCKHAFTTTEWLCSLRGPFQVVIKKSSFEKSQSNWVEFRDASLPGYELGIELSLQLQNNGKAVKRWLYVWFEVTVRLINPLPGYDWWGLRTLVCV